MTDDRSKATAAAATAAREYKRRVTTADLFTSQADYRKDGPETSKKAAISVEESGEAVKWRVICLEAVKKWPGLTAGEIAKRLGVERAKVSRRLPELARAPLNLIEKRTPRKCNVSHREAATWKLKRGDAE